MKNCVRYWPRKALPVAIQLLALGWSAQVMAAQINAGAGVVIDLPGLTWDGSSTVLESIGAGAQINVNSPTSLSLTGATLFNAKDGGGISLNNTGTASIINGRIGKLEGDGQLLIDRYHFTVDNRAAPISNPALEIKSSIADNQINYTVIEYYGGGAGELLEVSGGNLTLNETRIYAENSRGALNMLGSMDGRKPNVTINGGRYEGVDNIDYFRGTRASGATIDVGGGDGAVLRVQNNATILSDAAGNAMHLRSGIAYIDDSRILGGNAGVLSSASGGTLILDGSEVNASTGTAILANAYDYAWPSRTPTMSLTATDSVLSGINGIRVEGQGLIDATLDRSIIQVDGIAISADRQGMVGTGESQVNATLQNSRIEAGSAFQADNNSELNITLTGSDVYTLGAALIAAQATNSGQITLNSQGSTIRGDLISDTTSTLDATLTQGSLLTGKVINGNRLTLDNSVWDIPFSSSMDTLNNLNGSQIIISVPGNPMSITDYKTLTVNGDYTGGGSIQLNTWLGGNDSPSDRLIVGGNTSGETTLYVNNTGGPGEETTTGIQLVQVAGTSNGAFVLGNRVVAGMYQYDLYQRTLDGGWYLSNALNPNRFDQPGGSNAGQTIIAPESGVYAHNLSIASNMFMHTLHDRMGEPQFTDSSKRDGWAPGVWMRVVGSTAEGKGGNGQLDIDTDTTVVQLGGDLVRWSSNGSDRWHIGLMGGYGRSDIDATNTLKRRTSGGLSNTASGKVEGYNVGAYATWFANQNKPSGPYVDTWVQYGWFDNKVQGNRQKEESYDSDGWTASVEAGYAFVAGQSSTRQWMIEPQVQVAYSSYQADDHRTAGGTRVTDGKAEGVITRLGARFYSRGENNAMQPFVEANWWYDGAQGTQRFDGEVLDDDTPDNRYELKAGLQGEIAKGWQLWGHVGGQWGKDSYSRYEGMLGVKHVF